MVKIHVKRVFGDSFLVIEEGKASFVSHSYANLFTAKRAAKIWQKKIPGSEIVDHTVK